MEIKTSVWLQQVLMRLDLMKTEDYQDQVSILLDEQPFLMGFIFNLEEDFTETAHELLVRCTVAMEKSLGEVGLYFNIITTDMLENIVDELIEKFEALEAQGEEAFTEEAVFEMASSPATLRGLYSFVDQNTTEDELPIEARSNLLLILSAIVELFEESAAKQAEDKTQLDA